MAEYIVRCRNLVKNYGKFTAFSDLNLDIEKGKIVGLLGPNGSGKTTFIKTLAGLLTVDGGILQIDGMEPGVETKAIISYLPERPYFNPQQKVSELIKFFAEFYEDFRIDVAEKLLADLGINANKKIASLSKGNKEKVQLILVMARNAKLYLLDEPIAGVDPAARDYILSTIVSNYNPDASIIITTHLISDVEQVLDDFMFITYGGRIVLSGNAEEVRNERGMSLDAIFREEFKC